MKQQRDGQQKQIGGVYGHCKRQVAVLRDEVGSERNCGRQQEEPDVDPQESSVKPLHVPELVVMRHPKHGEDQKADDVYSERCGNGHEVTNEVGVRRKPHTVGQLDVQNQERHGHRENSVDQRFHAAFGWHLRDYERESAHWCVSCWVGVRGD